MSFARKATNKHRLFVALYDRFTETPSFHIGLLLAPKNAGPDSGILFHITNFVRDDNPMREDGKVPWKYRREPVTPRRTSPLVAKILIAKLPAIYDLDYWGDRIDSIAGRIPLVDDFNCRTWAFVALTELSAEGGEYFKDLIPGSSAANTEKFQVDMVNVGTQAHIKLLEIGLDNFKPVERDFRKQQGSAT